MSDTTPDTDENRKFVRTWPALILIGLAAVLIPWFCHQAGEDETQFALVLSMGIFSTGLALVLWWLLGSRIAWKQRAVGLAIFITSTGLTALASHWTMGFLVAFFASTAFLILTALWLTVCRRLTSPGARWGLVSGAVILIALCVTHRFDGTMGSFAPRFPWRWTPTSEEENREFFVSHASSGELKTKEARPPLKLAAEDWPGFRGPQRDGVLRSLKIRTDWKSNPPKQLWKHPVGPGWSSFCVVDGRAFTQEQRFENELVVCYDAKTGKEIWQHAQSTRFREAVGGDGPRATPTFHEGRLYSLGATGYLCCLDARTGHKHWSVNVLQDNGAENITWGMAGSPLIVDHLVIVSPGGGNGKSLVAYDQKTGKRAWSGGSDTTAYSSPQYAVLAGQPLVLIFNNAGLCAHDPKNGKQLWTFPWESDQTNNAIQPCVLDESSVILSSTLVGTMRLKVTRPDGKWKIEKEWHTEIIKLYYNDMVAHEGYGYALNHGTLSCFDLKTGKRVWKGGRYRSGQILLLKEQGLLLIQGELGFVALVKATSKGLQEVARLSAIKGKTWNHPVVAKGLLFVRNDAEAACFDVSPLPTTGAE